MGPRPSSEYADSAGATMLWAAAAARDSDVVAVEPRDQMQARRGALHVDHAAEAACERARERIAPLAIHRRRAPHVQREMPFSDERGERGLQRKRGPARRHRARRGERVDQRVRDDDPGHAQARRERLAERADVQHARSVETLQCGQRRAVVAELRVVVVLDDVRVRRARPREQLQPPPQPHHDAGGVLMRRRRVREPRVSRRAREVEPVVVERHRDEPAARSAGRVQHRGVARIFDGDRFAGIDEHVGDQRERGARAFDDDDVVCAQRHAARLPQVRRDRVAQRAVAALIAVAARLVGVEPAVRDPPPHGGGKQREIGHARAEQHRLAATVGIVRRAEPPRAHRQPRCDERRRVDAARARRQPTGDIRARADARFEIALRDELVERLRHGVARHAELLRERAGRVQSRAAA